MLSRKIGFLFVGAALIAAGLACNLQRKGATQTPVPIAQRPTVEILEPAEGAVVTRGQIVSVKARATGTAGITLVELRVNGLVVDSQVPPEGISPTLLDVLLDYQTTQSGAIPLTVTAYSNGIAGQSVQRTINVLDPLNPGTGGAGTPQIVAPTATLYNPLCRARLNVNLNFRTGPGTEYDLVKTLDAGLEIQITGYADRTDGRWWQVTWGGQFGWVKESYTTQLGDCSTIRPAVVPASPTPVPTTPAPPTQAGATSTPTLPDLSLSMLEGARDIQLSTTGTAQATYIIRIVNSGGQAAGQFNVGVLLPNGTIQDLGIVAGLTPGQEIQIPSGGLNVTFDSPGIKRLLVTVDTNNTVAESNESNNQAYLDITVNPNPTPPTATPAPTITP